MHRNHHPIVKKVDNATHWTNYSPEDNPSDLPNTKRVSAG